jgi:hypothetical protein
VNGEIVAQGSQFSLQDVVCDQAEHTHGNWFLSASIFIKVLYSYVNRKSWQPPLTSRMCELSVLVRPVEASRLANPKLISESKPISPCLDLVWMATFVLAQTRLDHRDIIHPKKKLH